MSAGRWRLAAAWAVGLSTTACATTHVPARDVPPLTMAVAVPNDSARALLLEAMRSERVPIDGNGHDGSVVTSTYKVRRGGIGEAEVRLRFLLATDDAGSTLIEVEGISTERPRGIGAGDRGAAAQRAQAREIPPNDLEALRPLQRILRRLEAAGGRISHTP